MATVEYYKQGKKIQKKVFFTGSTAIRKGQGLFYDYDYGTATTKEELRVRRVEVGSPTNARWFAGVADQAYAAVPGGREILINEPGSDCEVLVGNNCTLGDILTCTVSPASASGFFIKAGFSGRGTARILQTRSDILPDATYSASFTAADAYTNSTKTIAKSHGDNGVAAGDTFLLLGADSASATFVENTVESVTTDSIVLTTAIGGNCNVSWVILDASVSWLAFAHLEEGEESGGVEFLSPIGNSAVVHMEHGYTYLCPATIGTADSTDTLSDAANAGIRKGYYVLGNMTTNQYVVTCASSNVIAPDASATAEDDLTFSTAGECLELRSTVGLKWALTHCSSTSILA